MKINLFVAREIQYFCFNLPTHAFSVPTRAFNLATRVFSLLTRGFELVTHGFELVTRNSCFTLPQNHFLNFQGFTYFLVEPRILRNSSKRLLP